MPRLTLKAVNKALAAAGIADRLHQGEGYFYFWGDVAADWFTSSVYVPRLNDLTVSEWVAEYRRLQQNNP